MKPSENPFIPILKAGAAMLNDIDDKITGAILPVDFEKRQKFCAEKVLVIKILCEEIARRCTVAIERGDLQPQAEKIWKTAADWMRHIQGYSSEYPNRLGVGQMLDISILLKPIGKIKKNAVEILMDDLLAASQ